MRKELLLTLFIMALLIAPLAVNTTTIISTPQLPNFDPQTQTPEKGISILGEGGDEFDDPWHPS